MRTVTAIDPKWLVEFAGTFYKMADAKKITKRKKEEKIEPLHNRFEAKDEWRISKAMKYKA